MSGELEKAAGRQREREAAATAAKRTDAGRFEKFRVMYRAEMLREAFAGTAGRWAQYIATGVCLVAPILIFVLVFHTSSAIALVATAFGTMISSLTAAFNATRPVAALRFARLKRLPGLDMATLREQLCDNWRHAKIRVDVTFTARWPRDPATAVDATKGLLRSVDTVEWRTPQQLSIATTDLETTYAAPSSKYGRSAREFNNAVLGEWLSRFAKRMVPALAEVAPIATVAITIDGAREPWDEHL
jgi:hypothetical protein